MWADSIQIKKHVPRPIHSYLNHHARNVRIYSKLKHDLFFLQFVSIIVFQVCVFILFFLFQFFAATNLLNNFQTFFFNVTCRQKCCGVVHVIVQLKIENQYNKRSALILIYEHVRFKRRPGAFLFLHHVRPLFSQLAWFWCCKTWLDWRFEILNIKFKNLHHN